MGISPQEISLYRHCDCHDAEQRPLGDDCPRLATDEGHSTWAYEVEPLGANGSLEIRRGVGYPSAQDAWRALEGLLAPKQNSGAEASEVSIGAHLVEWFERKEAVLRPATAASYTAVIHKDLVPAFGVMRISDLRSRHIMDWAESQLARGRGPCAVQRVVSTLRTALFDAVRHGLVFSNVARDVNVPRPVRRSVYWTPQQAATFRRHNAHHNADQLRYLFEVLDETHLPYREVLALHWADLHLADKRLYVRWALTSRNSAQPYLVRARRNWIGLSEGGVAALQRQRSLLPSNAPLEGLVFPADDGAPLRPEWVLQQFRKRSAEAQLPRISLNDISCVTSLGADDCDEGSAK
ncbi:tyrosine-type recombinase/integrase [Streptacidiphilus cavernicola]|uniref:Tyrosine-type recombinase/integrase n=1 Tax=Streptacidiphilus cavernicola TaxID=3342716 RepID=A0ABV6W3A6_9ACTN